MFILGGHYNNNYNNYGSYGNYGGILLYKSTISRFTYLIFNLLIRLKGHGSGHHHHHNGHIV